MKSCDETCWVRGLHLGLKCPSKEDQWEIITDDDSFVHEPQAFACHRPRPVRVTGVDGEQYDGIDGVYEPSGFCSEKTEMLKQQISPFGLYIFRNGEDSWTIGSPDKQHIIAIGPELSSGEGWQVLSKMTHAFEPRIISLGIFDPLVVFIMFKRDSLFFIYFLSFKYF